jgi:molybdopterin synthase sulfur carrier subunit
MRLESFQGCGMDNSDAYQALGAHAQGLSLTVLYFARLREALGIEREQVAVPDTVSNVAALREHLRGRGGAWASELASTKPVRVAVNQDMGTDQTPLRSGDEIAFFPPVTGG